MSNELKLHANHDIQKTGSDFPFFHKHEEYEIYLLDTGNRKIIINDLLYDTMDNDVAMILPNILHRSLGNTPYSGICISFSQEYLNKFLTPDAQTALLECFKTPVLHLDAEIARKIHTLTDKIMEHENDSFADLVEILSILSDTAKKSDGSSKSMTDKKLNPIVEYISSNYLTISGLDEISDRLHINKSYLCRFFKAKTGITVTAYINLLKLRFAQTLLSTTDFTVEHIAVKSGFDSTSYFCRTFKRLIGITPNDFRKSIKNTDT